MCLSRYVCVVCDERRLHVHAVKLIMHARQYQWCTHSAVCPGSPHRSGWVVVSSCLEIDWLCLLVALYLADIDCLSRNVHGSLSSYESYYEMLI